MSEARARMTVHPMPRPPLPQRLSGRLAALDRTWAELMGQHPFDGHGDFENWVEMAERLTCAREVFGERLALNSERPEHRHLPEIGVSYGWHSVRADVSAALADDYARLEAFAGLAGRRTWITSDELADGVIAKIHASGRDAFVKSMRAKALVATRVPRGQTLTTALDRAIEDATGEPGCGGIALMSVMDEPDGLLVQEAITMRFEYRCWVVDGRPVMGAGAIGELTPLDSRGARFDDLVAEHRGGSAPASGPEVVRRLVATARHFADLARAEVPDMSEYVVDVALDEEDRPVVIELNSWQNAGLYASAPLHLYKALATRSRLPRPLAPVVPGTLVPFD